MTNTFNKQGLVDFVFHYNREGVYRPALDQATKISEFVIKMICWATLMLQVKNAMGFFKLF